LNYLEILLFQKVFLTDFSDFPSSMDPEYQTLTARVELDQQGLNIDGTGIPRVIHGTKLLWVNIANY
jgi:hypothetical protein